MGTKYIFGKAKMLNDGGTGPKYSLALLFPRFSFTAHQPVCGTPRPPPARVIRVEQPSLHGRPGCFN